MGIYKDKLSILEKVESGEMSIEDAQAELKSDSEGNYVASASEDKQSKENIYMSKTANIPTRRERRLALAETYQNWQPHMMVGLGKSSDNRLQWPWKDKNWQWMWQNFGYPVYVNHSLEVENGAELNIVQYQGDLFIRGWNEPLVKFSGAVFDIRIGQEDNVVRVASSTGQMQVWVPNSISRIEARIEPGDMWISNVSADLDLSCQSGDLGCEKIQGDVKVWANGGDIRLMSIEGAINAVSNRGNTEVRDIVSDDVILKTTEGNIWLTLNSVSRGRFRCENDKGDINLLTNGEMACELLMEASMGGRISPVMLPWQRLLERSEGRLRGILNGGGASVSLITQGGKIYVQESWLKTFPIPSAN